jgi:hypothetical protein
MAGKIKKQEAYELVRSAYLNNTGVSRDSLRDLVDYFVPPLPKVAKTADQWVSSACAKNDVRDWPNLIFVHGGFMYSTDGHRMYRAVTGLPSGYYEPKTLLPSAYRGAHPITTRLDYFFPKPLQAWDRAALRDGTQELGVNTKNANLLRFDCSKFAFDAVYLYGACNGCEDTTLYFYENRVSGRSPFGEFILMGVR